MESDNMDKLEGSIYRTHDQHADIEELLQALLGAIVKYNLNPRDYKVYYDIEPNVYKFKLLKRKLGKEV
jgi:hypothetical protein